MESLLFAGMFFLYAAVLYVMFHFSKMNREVQYLTRESDRRFESWMAASNRNATTLQKISEQVNDFGETVAKEHEEAFKAEMKVLNLQLKTAEIKQKTLEVQVGVDLMKVQKQLEDLKKIAVPRENPQFRALSELSKQVFPGYDLTNPLKLMVSKQNQTTTVQTSPTRAVVDDTLLTVEDDATTVRIGIFDLNRQQAMLVCALLHAWVIGRKIALPVIEPGSDDGFMFNDWLISEAPVEPNEPDESEEPIETDEEEVESGDIDEEDEEADDSDNDLSDYASHESSR